MRHIPVFSYRFTPHSLGHRLQLRRWAYALERFFAASIEDIVMYYHVIEFISNHIQSREREIDGIQENNITRGM